MNAFGAAHLLQCFVIRKQTHRLLHGASQQLFQVAGDRIRRRCHGLHQCCIEPQGARHNAFEQILDGRRDTDHTVDIDHVQRAVGLVQLAFGLPQQRRTGIRVTAILRAQCRLQGAAGAGQGVADFTDDPGQRRGVEVGRTGSAVAGGG